MLLINNGKDGSSKSEKLSNMSRVVSDYIERYKPNLENERAEYLNRTTGQVKHIVQLDTNFVRDFSIPNKERLIYLNRCLFKFMDILEKCSRYQKYSEFDSNE